MNGQHVLESVVLCALSWPALRAATSAAYRRVFPYDSILFATASLLYIAVVLLIAFYEPRWLTIPAVFAGAIGSFFLWRARPAYGVSSGLPPGSLSLLPVQPWSDPDFYKRQAARYGDVFKLSQFGQPMVCLVGLDRATRLLAAHDEQLVVPPLPFSRFIEGGYLRYLPEDTHARYRRFFRSLFHSAAAVHAEPRIAAVFDHALMGMVADSAGHGSVEVRPAVARMIFAAWAELFFGIGEDHSDFNRLVQLNDVIRIGKARWMPRRRVDAALREIEAILRRRVSTFTPTEIASDSCFLAVLARTDPEALNDRTILGNLIYIKQATWGDVSGLLTWLFKMIIDHPVWRERLARTIDVSPASGRELATRMVQETLRLEQSEHRYRRTVADLELDGFRIPKGWLVRICVRESHQNPKIFPNPSVFDPDRFVGRPLTRDTYAPFGAFRLSCIGEELAKMVGAVFLLELAKRFECEVVDDGPPEIDHFAHNAPSPRFRVRMSARSNASSRLS